MKLAHHQRSKRVSRLRNQAERCRYNKAKRLPETLFCLQRLKRLHWKPRRVVSPLQRDEAFEQQCLGFFALAIHMGVPRATALKMAELEEARRY